jgi:UDP-glucose 4-epimerase
MTEDTPARPDDAYGRSKLKAERFLEKRAAVDGIDITILRPTVLYGEGMNLHSSGMKTFTSIDKGIMPLVGKGDTIFNLLYVENFIHAIMLAIDKGRGFRIYNVSEGPYTLVEVISMIESKLGKKGHRRIPKSVLYLIARFFWLMSPLMKGPPPVSMIKYRGLTTSNWHLDSSRIERELGFKPPFSLEQGVDRTIRFYGLGSDHARGG